MISYQITIPQWLALPIELRQKLKSIFGIPRTGGTQIQDDKVLSDGHTHEDLAHISIEKMQAYLKSEKTEFFPLLEEVLEKLANETQAEYEAKQEEEDEKRLEEANKSKATIMQNVGKLVEHFTDEITTIEKRKRGRPAKA